MSATRADDLSKGAAWMDGAVLPIDQATLPVTDWGLIHSDVAYDVAPVWEGAFFRLDDYLERFAASCAALRLETGLEQEEIRAALHAIAAATGLRAAYVAMVATRGRPRIAGSRDPRDCENRFYAWCVPYIHVIKPDALAAGAAVRVARSVRRIPDQCVDARVKNYHWGDFTMGLMEAKDLGFETVLLRDIDGNLAEGPGFNVFIVKNGALKTPARHCLRGLTRRTVLELAAELGLSAVETDISLEALYEADEVFLTSSGGGPLWIARVDDRTYANGAEGPVSRVLRDAYWRWVAEREDLRDPIAYGTVAGCADQR